ncbi:nucleotide sugar dehydrogenase [Herbiconiux sp. KACC 21604]|uniref:nucleotide sugar dehydrogenase n=1 Tax=unclassified Herbiconiux TaxID=2618217 RepID=UPI00149204E0|nr:nucleotide sugar dehydrogenase [Herbiconiux sp. SALV-R1]QJU54572.1 nucleotide sugar dehydrogenase [Herbiconiux sp. SALV-R1]WPO85658.1 nucleotide sugar dehydrogenase [Herbiconiux sp. KACC 21604]
MRVAVLGLGYVGCVTAACVADAGNVVVGIDPSVEKVEAVNNGLTPLVEPGLQELMAKVHGESRLTATTDVAAVDDVDIAIICVGTPSTAEGELDLVYVESVAKQIGSRIRERTSPLTIMLRSTVLPGTTRDQIIPWLEEASGKVEGADFFVAFCPEFLRESTAIADFYAPPFTVIGVESEVAAERPSALLEFIDVPPRIVTTGVAEALKYSSNVFHAVKVTFANEIGRFCDASGIDAREVMKIFVEDRQLNISPRYLKPGFAFGGSCLPKDVKAVQFHSKTVGVDLPLIDSLTVSNKAHIEKIVDLVRERGVSRVAQIGVTFKPSTDDVRESPFLALAARLIEEGVTVSAYDPIIQVDKLIGANRSYVESILPSHAEVLTTTIDEALEGAELVLIGTHLPEELDHVVAHSTVPVVDLSGLIPVRYEDALKARNVPGSPVHAYTGAAW